VVVFWDFSENTGESILNGLEAVYVSDVYVQEKRTAVDYRCSDGSAVLMSSICSRQKTACTGPRYSFLDSAHNNAVSEFEH